MQTIAIIQTRMGSTRLPEKALADVAGRPMLMRVVERARKIEGVDQVVIATSFASADVQIVNWCQLNGIPVYRGGRSEADVLGRYFDVATQLGADVVVRITGDCPMLDPVESAKVLALFREGEYDYVSNVSPRVVPDGYDTEVLSMAALAKVHNYKLAQLPKYREHVTKFILNHPNNSPYSSRPPLFNVGAIDGDQALGSIKWSVDTAEELETVRAMFADLGDDFGLAEALAWWEKREKKSDADKNA